MKKQYALGELASATLLAALGLVATAYAKDTRVFWLLDGNQSAIHRFNVTDVGTTNEVWTETEPLCTFTGAQNIANVIPAHGYYYVCLANGEVYRYGKNGVKVGGRIGTIPQGQCFEMSADQAFIYGSDMTLKSGQNKVSRLHLGSGASAVVVTNGIAQVRCLSWGKDDLLYCASRSNADGVDYYGNPITSGQYRGVQAVDVSGGFGAVLKHTYAATASTGGCVADVEANRIYSFGANKAFIYGRSEFGADGERTDSYRALLGVTLGNAFSGAMIAGHPYTADWKDGGPSNLYRFNTNNTATLVAMMTNSAFSDSTNISKVRALREDLFPENDTTIALTTLSEYWSFNHAGETSTGITGAFTSLINPARVAHLDAGFTAGVRGAVREGLWCAAGANGRVLSAMIVPQDTDFTISFFVGFPSALTGAQTLLRNPKMTVSVTASGALAAALVDGKDKNGTATSGASVTGTSSLADGAWHYVAVTRRDNKLEVWVDGVKEGESAETTVAVYDDLNTQWYFLDAANPNKMFIDELRIYTAALTQNDLNHLRSLATDGLKVPRDPSARSNAAATAVGTVLGHADAEDHAWGIPCILADPNGQTLYAAADFGRGRGENNQSVIWKSTDRGVTWARIDSEASLGALALFRFDGDGSGIVRAAAIDPDGYIAWGLSSSDGCSTWGTFHQQSTTPLLSAWYPTFCGAGYARNLALAEGIYNLDVMADNKGKLIGAPLAMTNLLNTAQCPAGGVFGRDPPHVFYSQRVRLHPNATNAAPVETATLVLRDAENSLSYRGTVSFPGASRPFGAIWDATSARYWAVVTYAADGSTTPWTRANRLALYCATDAVAWQFCCDLAEVGTPSTAGFNNPNVAIVGDDLVAVFGASLNDGTGADAARDVNVSNYILAKRIPNFRSLAPDKKYTRSLLVGDISAGRIIRLYEDEETGEWVNGGYFAAGTYTDNKYSVGYGEDIKYFNGQVWILSNGRLFAFNPDGTFTGTCFDLTRDRNIVPYNPDSMGFSYDGRYIYTCYGFIDKTHANVKYIYRTDVATGVTMQFCKSTDEYMYDRLYRLRALVGLPDGRLAVSCRDGNLLFALKPGDDPTSGGLFDSDLWTNVSSPQTMYFDRRARKLYLSGFSNRLYCWDYATGAKTQKEGLANIIGITGDDHGRIFGTSYNSPAALADLLADNGAFTTNGHRLIRNGGLNYHRCCFFDTKPPASTVIILR